MSGVALPLWAEPPPPRQGGRRLQTPPSPALQAPAQRNDSAAKERQEPLLSLRGVCTLLLLALLLSLLAFVAELVWSYGAVPERYQRRASEDEIANAASMIMDAARASGKTPEAPYRPEVVKLLSAIDRDFAPWERDGIDLAAVEQMYCEVTGMTMRLQVVNGVGYAVGEMRQWMSRQYDLKVQIQEMLERWPGQIPDVDMFISSDDHPPGDRENPKPCHPHWGPVMSLDKFYESDLPLEPAHKWSVMMPCNTMNGWPRANVKPWAEERVRLRAAAAKTPWPDRIPKLLFRGGPTREDRIILFTDEDIQASPLTDILSASGDDIRDPNLIDLPDHCKYKYLLHLQGYAYATRLKWLMACGSVVLFPIDQKHYYQEFWYHMLEDGVNIRILDPVTRENNGSHVLEAVQWLENHPEEAERLAQGARRLVDEVLTPDNIQLYWRALFTKYGSLMNYKVELHPDAIPLETSIALGPDFLWPDTRECPRYRTCGNVCPLWPWKAIHSGVAQAHLAPHPMEGCYETEITCLADMFRGMA